MVFKYRKDIFDAITKSLLTEEQDSKIGYSELYNKCVQKLKCKISRTDFTHNLNGMIKENLLNKYEYKDSGLKIKPVCYSLTEKAMKEYDLKILGKNEKTEKRRNLFQLLIFFREFKRSDFLTEIQLGKLLRRIGCSRKDLKELRTSEKGFPKKTIYRPIKGVEIVKWIQSDPNANPGKLARYYVTIPGFTVEEFTSYLKRIRMRREPRPFSSYQGITDVPFVLYRNYTKKEVENAINSLRKDGLMKIINDVFPGEMRFDIANESLRRFVKDVWFVHLIDFRLLNERLAYDGKPTEEIKNYLALLYGQENVDRFLALTYPSRTSYKKEIKNDKEKRGIAEDFVRDFDNLRRSRIQDIIKTHAKVISEYEIASELLGGILHPSSRKEFSQM